MQKTGFVQLFFRDGVYANRKSTLQVWIYSSHLHLIPLSHVSSPSRKRRHRYPRPQDSDDEDNILNDDRDEFLAVEDALDLVRDATVATRASPEAEDLAWERTKRYLNPSSCTRL